MLLIGDILRRRAGPADRNRTALIFGDQKWTYGALNSAANRLANALIGCGVAPGDRVAILGRNSVEWAITYFAAARAGAILVPISYWFKGEELRFVLRDAGAKVLLVEERFADLIAAERANAPMLNTVIWIDTAIEGDRSYQTLVDQSSDAETDIRIDERDGHIIMYTSGTTGFPKGVLQSHRAHMLHAGIWAHETGARRDDVYLCTYPLFHTGGTDCGIVPPLYAGAAVVLLPWPDVGTILDAIETHRVTAFRAVPTVWKRLLARPDFDQRDLSSLRRVIAGSDAMPPELIHQIRQRIPQAGYLQNYGLTESGPVLTYLRENAPPEAYGSNGSAHAQSEIQIVNADDEPVPIGTIGEVVARSEHLMIGYWGLPEQTAEAMRGGWLHTGDQGHFDADGNLWITGRQKDLIITGSEHVYPAEIEAVLRLHAGVDEVAVIGVPDVEWGESVAAIVVPAGIGSDALAAELTAFVRERMSAFKRPKHVVFVDDLPRTGPTRKIQKATLREQYRHLGDLYSNLT